MRIQGPRAAVHAWHVGHSTVWCWFAGRGAGLSAHTADGHDRDGGTLLGLGWGEIFLIGAVALVVVGPERLPRLLRELGRYYGQLRRAADELRRSFVLEADRQDAEERYAKLQERRQAAMEARKAAMQASGGVSQEQPAPEPTAAAAGPEVDDGDDPPPDPNAEPPDAPHPVQVPRRTLEELGLEPPPEEAP